MQRGSTSRQHGAARVQAALRVFSAIDVYELSSEFVLVGHEGKHRRLLRIDRSTAYASAAALSSTDAHDNSEGFPPLALPPVEEDPRLYTQQECKWQLG